MNRIESWFCIEADVRNELDPILSDYEIARRNGIEPDRQRYMARCSSDSVRQVLEQELDYYDQFVEECHTPPAKNSSLESPVKIAVSDSINEYQIIRHIGKGNFADVYLAFDKEQDQRVALKIADASELSFEKRACFEREIEVLQLVDHHRIVKYLKSFQHGNLYVCVTEWIDGVTLVDALKSGPLPLKEMVNWLIEIADGLHFVHQKGILHRDVKPHNVMIDRSAHVRVLDFGLARLLNRASAESSICGQLKGSICYMSPEQARGDIDALDARSDVFSLGVLMYEALTGERPFDDRPEKALDEIRNHDPPGIRYFNPRLPVGLERICQRAMAKSPNQRYQSAQQMQYDLVAFLHDRQITLPASRQKQPAIEHDRPARKLGKRWLAVPVLIAAMAVWLGYQMLPGFNSSTQPVNQSLAGNNPDPLALPLTPGSTDPAAIEVSINTAPRGAFIAFVPLDGEDGHPKLDSVVQSGASPVRTKLVPGDYLVVAMLPNGQFNEVLRHVPFDDEERQLFPPWTWEMNEALVELPDITIVVPDTSVMKRSGDVWIDDREFAKSGRLRPAFVDARKLLPDNRFARLKFDEAMYALEKRGKRLPYLAELQAAMDEGLVEDADAKPEWTLDIRSTEFVRLEKIDSRSVTMQAYHCYPEHETEGMQTVISRCAFRGVRSARPLVRPVPVGTSSQELAALEHQ